MTRELDYDDDQALISTWNYGTRLERAEQELRALVHAIVSDHAVSDDEIRLLGDFLQRVGEFSNVWPFDTVWNLLARILEDGIVTDDERNELVETLNTLKLRDGVASHDLLTAERRLQAIAGAIRFDRRVTADEVALLNEFVELHQAFAETWPFNRVGPVLQQILADGVVSEDERRLLFDTLSSLDSRVRGPTDGLFDDDAEIRIEGKAFAITGVLQCGKRKELQARLAAVGGIIHDSVRISSDYLIAGDIGSDNWVTSRYGTKFQMVRDYRESGKASTKIIREVFAIEALTAAELRKLRGY